MISFDSSLSLNEIDAQITGEEGFIKTDIATYKLNAASEETLSDVISKLDTDLTTTLSEADAKAKEDAKTKAEANRKAKEEADAKAKEEADRKAKEEADAKANEEADAKAKEEANRKAKEEADRKAKEEADRKAEIEKKNKNPKENKSEKKYGSVPNYASLTLPGVEINFGKDVPCFEKIDFDNSGTYPNVFSCPANWGLPKPACASDNGDFSSLEGYNCKNFKDGESQYCEIYGDTQFLVKQQVLLVNLAAKIILFNDLNLLNSYNIVIKLCFDNN